MHLLDEGPARGQKASITRRNRAATADAELVLALEAKPAQ
jgi:hypothetical protein